MDGFGTLALVSAAGGIGTAARYLLSRAFAQHVSSTFPVGTLLINVLDSFLIGLLLPLALKRSWPEPVTLALTTGFLGGFTTYSAFNYDMTMYLGEGQWLKGIGYMGATVGGALLAGFAGLALSK